MRHGPKHNRHERWTKAMWIEAARKRAAEYGIQPGDLAPTSGQLGASLCNAARRLWGNLGPATIAAGFEPNGGGACRAKKMRQREEDAAPRPAPRPKLVRDPVVAAELAASLERQRKREAERVAKCRRVNRLYGERARHRMRGRGDFHSKLKSGKWDEFVPPLDLTGMDKHARRAA